MSKGNSWEDQVIMHRGSRKQGGHRYLANTWWSRDSKSRSVVPQLLLRAPPPGVREALPLPLPWAAGAEQEGRWGHQEEREVTSARDWGWWSFVMEEGSWEGGRCPYPIDLRKTEKAHGEGVTPKASHRTLPSGSHSPSPLGRLPNPLTPLQTFYSAQNTLKLPWLGSHQPPACYQPLTTTPKFLLITQCSAAVTSTIKLNPKGLLGWYYHYFSHCCAILN